MRPSSLRVILLFIIIITNFVYSQTVTWNFWENKNYLVSSESDKWEIIKLQKLFQWIWLYKWELDWNYDNIKKVIVSYQIKKWIIKNSSSADAWIFTSSTAEAIKEEFINKKDTNTPKKEIVKIDPYFIVTAYYSPVPNQKKYITWTYEWDIRLNWSWIIWASWKAVHSWFIAAPKKYEFWTKIELEWLWVWVVQDRWWAIVEAWVNWHEHDRFDIWMWYWDAWLERAIKWWKRTVKWKIVPPNSKITIEFETYIVDEYWDLTLDWDNPNPEDVKRLQELFKKLKLYDWKIDWDFSKIKKDFLDFQKRSWIIENDDDWWAWYFGQKTYIALREQYWDISEWDEIKESKSFELSQKEKDLLNKIRQQIQISISKKTNWDLIKQENYIKNIKNQLESYIEKVDDKKNKNKLEYFIEIL